MENTSVLMCFFYVLEKITIYLKDLTVDKKKQLCYNFLYSWVYDRKLEMDTFTILEKRL